MSVSVSVSVCVLVFVFVFVFVPTFRSRTSLGGGSALPQRQHCNKEVKVCLGLAEKKTFCNSTHSAGPMAGHEAS